MKRNIERQKRFNEFVLTGRFSEGADYFKAAADDLGEQATGNSDTDFRIHYVETFCMNYRLKAFIGKQDEIKEGVEKYREKRVVLSVYEEGELSFLTALVMYDQCQYAEAYERLLESIELLRKKEDLQHDYLLMRLHLLCAKLAWRREDFHQARVHLGLSLAHYLAYDKIYRKQVPEGPAYYLRGRIYTVLVRLLVQRQGPQPFGATENPLDDSKNGEGSYSDLAQDLLQRVRLFYRTDCPLTAKKGGRHFFLLETDELEAVVLRNRARRAGKEKREFFFKESNKLLGKAIEDIGQLLENNEPHRRKAHLYRLRGENNIFRVLRAVRSGKSSSRVREYLRHADADFKAEVTIRVGVFIRRPHITLARAWNFRALGFLLCFLLDEADKLKVNPKLLRGVWLCSCLALRKNGFKQVWSPEAMRAQIENTKPNELPGLSVLQLISSYSCIMQADLHGRLRRGDFDENVFQEMKIRYHTALAASKKLAQSYGSFSAKEDLERQLRPLHESMLEACHLRLLANNENELIGPEDEKLIFTIFRKSIAPTIMDRIYQERGEEEQFVTKRESFEQQALNALIGEFPRTENTREKLIKDLLKLYAGLGDRSKRTVKVPPFIKDEKIKHCFERTAGGLINFFVGYRHIFAFCFGGKEEDLSWPLRLVKLHKDQPFKAVSEVKGLTIKLQGAILALLQNRGSSCKPKLELKEDPESLKDYQLNRELLELSEKLYQLLLLPVGVPDDIKRFYIVPDRELWRIPWSLLPCSIPPEGAEIDFTKVNFLAKNKTVTLHTSMSAWQDRSKQIKEMPALPPEAYYWTGSIGWKNGFIKEYGTNLEYSQAVENAAARALRICETKTVYTAGASFFLHGPGKVKPIIDNLKTLLREGYIYHYHGHQPEGGDGNFEPTRLPILENKQGQLEHSLTQHEIEGLDLSRLFLVILILCYSDQGETTTGNLPRALNHAFLYAGVTNILYASYSIHADHSRRFVEYFADRIGRKQEVGLTTLGEAFHEAQNAMMKKEYTCHPCHWGLIQFIGSQIAQLRDHPDD